MRSIPSVQAWSPAGRSGIHRVVYCRGGLSEDSPPPLTFHPAQPLCVLLWQWSGRFDWQPVDREGIPERLHTPVSGPLIVRGPMSTPCRTIVEGAPAQLWVWLYPDGLERALGIPPDSLRDNWEPWQPSPTNRRQAEACTRIVAEGWTPATGGRLAELLGEADLQLVPNSRPASLTAWRKRLQGLLHPPLSKYGQRTAQRRHRRLCGMTAQELDRLAKVDAALQKLLGGPTPLKGQLGRVASECGFCDQSYLIRSVRQATGWSPTELRKGVAGDASFWPYRALYTAQAGRADPAEASRARLDVATSGWVRTAR